MSKSPAKKSGSGSGSDTEPMDDSGDETFRGAFSEFEENSQGEDGEDLKDCEKCFVFGRVLDKALQVIQGDGSMGSKLKRVEDMLYIGGLL